MNSEKIHSSQKREFEVTSEKRQRKPSTESEISSIPNYDNEKYIGSSSTPLSTSERSKKVLQKFQEVIDVIDDTKDESLETKQEEGASVSKKRHRKRGGGGGRGNRDSVKDEYDQSVSRRRKKKHARQRTALRRSDRFYGSDNEENRMEQSIRRLSDVQHDQGDTELQKQAETTQG